MGRERGWEVREGFCGSWNSHSVVVSKELINYMYKNKENKTKRTSG